MIGTQRELDECNDESVVNNCHLEYGGGGVSRLLRFRLCASTSAISISLILGWIVMIKMANDMVRSAVAMCQKMGRLASMMSVVHPGLYFCPKRSFRHTRLISPEFDDEWCLTCP